MGGVPYVLLRCALWFVGIAAAAFPVYYSGGITDVSPWDAAARLNSVHLFRELFYLIIIASVLAVSNLLDFMVKKYKQAHTYQCFLALFALLFFFIVTGIGFVGFTGVPVDGTVPAANLSKWVWTIVATLTISLIVEISWAMADQPDSDARSRHRGYGQWP